MQTEIASAFKYTLKMKMRGRLLLSVCSSFRIDFYQRQFLVIIAFVGVVILSSLLLIWCLHRDGGPKDKLLGPYWNLLLIPFVAVIVYACIVFTSNVSFFLSLNHGGFCDRRALTKSRFKHSNELLPLKMQKHFTLYFNARITDLRGISARFDDFK